MNPFSEIQEVDNSGFFLYIDDYPHDKSITLPFQTSMICFVFFFLLDKGIHDIMSPCWKMCMFLVITGNDDVLNFHIMQGGCD